MAHPIWKGFISFGLVNIPVVLYSGEKRKDLQFKLVDRRNLARIHYERINDDNGAEVPWNDVAKAFEYEKGNYVVVQEEDFAKVAPENLKTIEIEEFVPGKEVECLYFEKPYYLVPDKRGEKGYVLLREVLKDTKKVAITKVMIRTNQYIAALLPFKEALVLNILKYSDEVKLPAEFDLPRESIKHYKISPKEIKIAEQLVANMSGKWEPRKYQNEFHDKMLAIIEDKIKHKGKSKVHGPKPKAIKQTKVVDFMELLQKSLKEKAAKKSAAAKTKTTPKRAHK